jgi:hypothetical protein
MLDFATSKLLISMVQAFVARGGTDHPKLVIGRINTSQVVHIRGLERVLVEIGLITPDLHLHKFIGVCGSCDPDGGVVSEN